MKGMKKGDSYMFAKIKVAENNTFLSEGGLMLFELTFVCYGGTGRNVKIVCPCSFKAYTLEFATENEAKKFVEDLSDTGKAEATAKIHH